MAPTPTALGELRVGHRWAPGEAEALSRREPSVARGPSTLRFMPFRPVCRGHSVERVMVKVKVTGWWKVADGPGSC